MFTHKDIEHRTIFVINCIKDRSLRVSNGELLLEEKVEDADVYKTLTKMPFQKMLALFVVGHISVTTPLIEKCQRFGVALVVVKPSLRPVFFWSNTAEANFLLRQRQYALDKEDLTIARILIANKIRNQCQCLINTRRRDDLTLSAIERCQDCESMASIAEGYSELMGLEGLASRIFFEVYYQDLDWSQRRPRTKCDALNATLDIGYTILFNYIECFLRMFGFDLYVGVFHRLWFKRKSLVCDVMEPFRCIIDKTTRTAYHRNQFSEKDFDVKKGEYILKRERNADYCRVYFDALIPYKIHVFKYVQAYYRCFMGGKPEECYPKFYL
ncbi:MAG: type V CRISPR-associated endonuclease Cas1 [Bacteroidaceae bacterium]|nr:type V CRISPR-associated endonuclease Cas1 [Bacteroidaceae bacterium]